MEQFNGMSDGDINISDISKYLEYFRVL